MLKMVLRIPKLIISINIDDKVKLNENTQFTNLKFKTDFEGLFYQIN